MRLAWNGGRMTCPKCKGVAYFDDPDPVNPGHWKYCVNCSYRGEAVLDVAVRRELPPPAAPRRESTDARGKYARTPETRAKLSLSMRAMHRRNGHKSRIVPITLLVDIDHLRRMLKLS